MSSSPPATHHRPPAKGHKRFKTLGYAVSVCAGIFVSGFIIGALVGGENRDRVIRAGILEHLLIRDKHEEGVFVVHTCGRAANFEYSFDRKSPLEIGSIEEGDVDLLERLVVHKEFLTDLLGGASAGVTFREFLVAAQKSLAEDAAAARQKMLTVLAAFFSAISGYGLGYWVGSTHVTGCNSEPVREKLRKADYWQDIIRRHLFGVLYALSLDRPDQLNKRRPPLLEIFEGPLANPAFACGFEWFRRPRIVKTVEYTEATFSSDEVREVLRAVATFQRMKNLPEYDALVKLQRDARLALLSPGFADAASTDAFTYDCLLDSSDSQRTSCPSLSEKGVANKPTPPSATGPVSRMKQACQALDAAYRAQSTAAP